MANPWHAWDARRLNDGYAHQRDRAGTCGNCGAGAREPHYKLVKR